MKTLIAVVVMLLSLKSFATSLHPDTFTKRANLVEAYFDGNDDFFLKGEVIGGKIEVNPVLKFARLTVEYSAAPCPIGRFCTMVMPIHTIELKLVKTSKDSCGVIKYVAMEDKMPVDGKKETLTIKDVRYSICEILYPALTLVEFKEEYYSRFQASKVENFAHFLATELE